MRRRIVVLVGVALVMAGLGLAALGGSELADGRARARARTVTATVTDLRVDTDSVIGTEHHEVRYLFDVGGATFSPGDASGRTDLFVEIAGEQWDGLSVGGPIEVTYDGADPGNNRPLSATGSARDAVAGVVTGLLMAAVGALLVLADRRDPASRSEPSDQRTADLGVSAGST